MPAGAAATTVCAILQAMMGELCLREVNAFTLATKLQRRDQPPISTLRCGL
jgi:hypothetical protein